MNADKMRRQLERTASFECGRRGCQINSRPHWHYMPGPDLPEEVVYSGSEREAEIEGKERMLSAFRVFGRQMDEVVLGVRPVGASVYATPESETPLATFAAGEPILFNGPTHAEDYG